MNKYMGIGNLTSDPSGRDTKDGNRIVKFGLAINNRGKNGVHPTFISIVAWNQLGKICETNLRKGNKIGIVGNLNSSSWEDATGKKTKIEVVAESVEFLFDRPEKSKPEVDDVDEMLFGGSDGY